MHTQVFLQNEAGEQTGEVVASIRNEKIVVRSGSKISNALRFKVNEPLLWDIETPYRYMAVSRVLAGGKNRPL